MHGSRGENARLIEDILGGYPANAGADCVVCPPFVYLQEVGRMLRDSPIALGAQDTCADAHGAFTGEVSAGMLKDVGCKYVLVGHSERRLIYRESDQLVARKFAAAHAKALIPVLCVGEQLSDREASRTEEVVGRQLDVVLELCGPEVLGQGVVAYEPVWAIGTGVVATVDEVGEAHRFILDLLDSMERGSAAGHVPVLYGGSVDPKNAGGLAALPDVDGFLVGGASLSATSFIAIGEALRAAERRASPVD